MATESDRYRLLRALISGPASPGRLLDVLDVGCGPGNLIAYLPPFESYTGVDISEAAVSRAPRGKGITYAVVPLELFEPSRLFSTIVFNEVLYYCQFELVIARYHKFLQTDGRVLTSLYDGLGQTPGIAEAISHELDRQLVLAERRIVSDEWSRKWILAAHTMG